jgi:hypothetical protein
MIASIRLDRAATPQHAHPVNVADGRFELPLGIFQQRKFGADHPRGHVDALQVFPKLREMPALIVLEGLVG